MGFENALNLFQSKLVVILKKKKKPTYSNKLLKTRIHSSGDTLWM